MTNDTILSFTIIIIINIIDAYTVYYYDACCTYDMQTDD